MDTLLDVKRELECRRGQWPAICGETGLSYDWLTKLMRGVIRDPGISKIDALQRYFKVHPLPPASGVAA
jgi:hypothetical protein